MIIEYIRYTIDLPRQPDFLLAYAEAGKSLEASPHCLGYELAQCSESPESFVLRILWTSTDAHLRGFRSSEQFKSFLAHVQPFIKDISEMRHYERTQIVWSSSGARDAGS